MTDMAKVRELNDAFRTGELSHLGRFGFSYGVQQLVTPCGLLSSKALCDQVQQYTDFPEDIDPFQEHDMGHFGYMVRNTVEGGHSHGDCGHLKMAA